MIRLHAKHFNHTAIVSLIALIALCIAWELWLAPLRSGGSWLVLKVLPLLMPLFGLLHARRYTHQWTSLLALAYFVEGSVRAMSDTGPSTKLAMVETLLAITLFASAALFARASARSNPKEGPRSGDASSVPAVRPGD